MNAFWNKKNEYTYTHTQVREERVKVDSQLVCMKKGPFSSMPFFNLYFHKLILLFYTFSAAYMYSIDYCFSIHV